MKLQDRIEMIAAVCHEANFAHSRATGYFANVSSWAEAEEWQRQSSIAGVAWVLETDPRSARVVHGHWMDQKLADGWVYGPVKDAAVKTHPCMVNFDKLPQEVKDKDQLFLEIVRLMDELMPEAEEDPK